MTNVEARIKIKGKEFAILVDVDKALQFRKGIGNIEEVLAVDEIFYDIKKGLKVSDLDLEKAFNTTNVKEAAGKIIKQGQVVLPSAYEKKGEEEKKKQIIDFLARNAINPTTNKPHSEIRIREALEQSRVKIENKPIEQQIPRIVSKLNEVLPIKIETKKLRITIPALYTGQVYGLFQEYKEKEDWLNNGDLKCTINIPSGLEMDFYDRLNAVTHGSAIVEEVKK